MSTATRERPILFSGPMVQAILAGRKTQTRRTLKPQPTHRIVEGLAHVTIGMDPREDGALWYDADGIGPGREVRCPYGRVGDRLWVRETHARRRDVDPREEPEKARHYCLYRADGDSLREPHWHDYGSRWRPAIHMPRTLSRITLEITGVRVERLHAITEADAWAEGFPDPKGRNREYPDRARYWFRHLWTEINGEESWLADPWVWVLDFRRLD